MLLHTGTSYGINRWAQEAPINIVEHARAQQHAMLSDAGLVAVADRLQLVKRIGLVPLSERLSTTGLLCSRSGCIRRFCSLRKTRSYNRGTPIRTIRRSHGKGGVRMFQTNLVVRTTGAVCAVLLVFLGSWPADLWASAERPTRSFGNLLYAVPSGYAAAGSSDGILMGRRAELETGNVTGLIAIPRQLQPDARLSALVKGKTKAQVAQALAVAVGNLEQDSAARFSEAVLVNDAQRDGYEAYRVITVGRDRDADKTRYSAVFVLFPGDLIHIVVAMGYGSEAALDGISPGLNALLSSIEFRNRGGRVPTAAQAPLPSSFSLPTRTEASGDSAAADRSSEATSDGSCRIVQRQMCSGGVGGGMGYFCNTYPQSECD